MTIGPFLSKVNQFILNPLIALAFALAVVYFFYSVVKFLRLDSADKSREEARMAILWSIVGMVIMFSVYGIIRFFILPTFGIPSSELTPASQQILKLNN